MQWVIFTPSILGGFIIGFTDIRYPTDLIRGASIGHIATELLQNSALILSVGLRTPIFGGDIREVQAELRPKSADLVKTEEIGRRFPRAQ